LAKNVSYFGKLVLFLGLAAFVFVLTRNLTPNFQITKEPSTKEPPPIPTLSLDSIFKTPNDLSHLNQDKLISLIATGDVIPARGANWPAVTSGDFTYNWKKTAGFLKKGDVTLINLEAPLTKGCPLQTSGFTFCGDSRHIKGIVFAGVDVSSLANNHIGNFGQEGIDQTTQLLESNKIGWSGFGHLETKTVKAVVFGFLAYNGIGTSIDVTAMKNEIKAAKKKVGVLIVSVHWGSEYELLPIPEKGIAPDDPKQIGKIMIDSGADLVIGNHPHTVQGVEIYKNKVIAYAHGNFIFDQTWSQETQEGVVGEYIFFGKNLVQVKYHPILVNVSYQPRFLSTKDGQHILNRMLKSSKLILK